MPVRDKAMQKLAEVVGGPVVFNNVEDTVTIGGRTERRESYENVVGGMWEKLVRSVDWNRVMLEAMARHLALDHEGEEVCGEDVMEALLARETTPKWEKPTRET